MVRVGEGLELRSGLGPVLRVEVSVQGFEELRLGLKG